MKINLKISMIAASAAIFAGAVAVGPVFTIAQTGSSASSTAAERRAQRQQTISAVTAQRVSGAKAQDTKEIDKRISSLNDLVAKVQGMKNVSSAQQTSIATTIQSLIANLQTLETTISSESSTTLLKQESQSITKAYRVYALVLPQTNLIAASDRIQTLAASLNVIAGKLQTRLSQASTSLSSSQTALADMQSKTADALSLSQAIISEVTPLMPDQGDKTIMSSNTTALKDARTKVQTANKDLVAARKDAQTIVQALEKAKPAKASATKAPAIQQ